GTVVTDQRLVSRRRRRSRRKIALAPGLKPIGCVFHGDFPPARADHFTGILANAVPKPATTPGEWRKHPRPSRLHLEPAHLINNRRGPGRGLLILEKQERPWRPGGAPRSTLPAVASLVAGVTDTPEQPAPHARARRRAVRSSW